MSESLFPQCCSSLFFKAMKAPIFLMTISGLEIPFLFFSYLSTGKRAEAKPCKYINECTNNSKGIGQEHFFQMVVNGMLPTSPSLLLGVLTKPQLSQT